MYCWNRQLLWKFKRSFVRTGSCCVSSNGSSHEKCMCNLKLMMAIAASALYRAQHGVQEARKSCTNGCTGHQNDPGRVQNRPSEPPKSTQDRPGEFRSGPKRPKSLPRAPKSGPRGSKLGPRGAQESPSWRTRDGKLGPRRAKLGPRGAKLGPRSAKLGFKLRPRDTKQQSKSICTAKTPEPRICTTLLHFWRFLKVLEVSLNSQVEPNLRLETSS